MGVPMLVWIALMSLARAEDTTEVGSVSFNVDEAGNKVLDVTSIRSGPGPELRDLHCEGVAGGLLGPMVLGSGLGAQREAMNACAPGGGAVRLTWTWSGGKPTNVAVASPDPKVGACLQAAFQGVSGMAQWTASCRGGLLVGDLVAADASYQALPK